LQNVLAYLPWHETSGRHLENNGDDGDKISTKELALIMHPIEQASVCFLRTSLSQTAKVFVEGSAEDYAGPFLTL